MKNKLRIIFFAVTVLCYGSVLVSPDIFWLSGFFALAIPLVILVHFVFLLFNTRKLKAGFFYHLIMIALGFIFIKVSYALSLGNDTGKLKVLSYNVRVFNNYATLKNEGYASSKKMVAWSVENDAPVKCFQEYYNNDKSDIFDVKKRLSKAGWKHQHFKIVLQDRAKAEFGIAIFSKLPIVHRGEVLSSSGDFLNTIFADIIVGNDTVRIYNTHLESMSIDENNVVDTDRLAKSYKDTGVRLRKGFISRARQVKALTASIAQCRHKTILCGDLNELPYSYPYFALRGHLNNAFEKAGTGFGFTYNGKLFFLRIDNQFFSDQIEINSFVTHRTVDYSDHFPLTASYSW
ncbi:MAG: endonuclease/exonuclease/phosphatase family protein [Cyclobacteriaceae bacterium]|nr:endonuclease/exonuclease/phosphatase family protein [Cyclobacteriaceae bacterium]